MLDSHVPAPITHGAITLALRAAQARETGAADRLFGLVEGELRARLSRLRGVRRDPSTQTTTLVHDAFLRLQAERATWQNRDHYLAVASRTMQRLVLDVARRQLRHKRGGGQPVIELEDHFASFLPDPDFLLDLQAALERIGERNPRWRKMAELRAYGGLGNPAIATELGVSLSTVEHDWRFVRAWLHRELA